MGVSGDLHGNVTQMRVRVVWVPVMNFCRQNITSGALEHHSFGVLSFRTFCVFICEMELPLLTHKGNLIYKYKLRNTNYFVWDLGLSAFGLP